MAEQQKELLEFYVYRGIRAKKGTELSINWYIKWYVKNQKFVL